jgi:hypothetical protein
MTYVFHHRQQYQIRAMSSKANQSIYQLVISTCGMKQAYHSTIFIVPWNLSDGHDRAVAEEHALA